MAEPRESPLPHPTTFLTAESYDLSAGDVVLGVEANGFYSGAGGNVTLILTDDSTVLYPNTIAGIQYDQRHKGFIAAGTDPTTILALF